MCMYSAVDGVPQEWHHTHLAQFASGGAGLVVAEATAVVPEGRISPRDTGLWNDGQRDAWAPIVEAVHARGARIGLQLAHAGRKASTWWPWADERGSVPAAEGGWTTVAPSAIAFEGFAKPVALEAIRGMYSFSIYYTRILTPSLTPLSKLPSLPIRQQFGRNCTIRQLHLNHLLRASLHSAARERCCRSGSEIPAHHRTFQQFLLRAASTRVRIAAVSIPCG